MGCGPSKDNNKVDKNTADDKPTEKPVAVGKAERVAMANKPAAKPAAKPTARPKPPKLRANNTNTHMSDALRSLITDYFNRYDLDGSGSINTSDELKQLCTNLIVKLDLDILMDDIYRQVEKAGTFSHDPPEKLAKAKESKEPIQDWNIEAFAAWFMNADTFNITDMQSWELGDESDDDEGPSPAQAPFFKGTYVGELTDSDGKKKYTIQMRKGRGTLNKDGGYEEYVTEALYVFNLKVRVSDTAPATKEGSKRDLMPRQCCDSVGYYKTSGWVELQKPGEIEYVMEYDVDNDVTTKEPRLVLKGTLSDDGLVITGTWENEEKDPAAKEGMKQIGLEGVESGVFKIAKRMPTPVE